MSKDTALLTADDWGQWLSAKERTALDVYKIKPIYLPVKTAFFRPGGLASQNIFRSYTEEMMIKVDNGEKIHKAFFIYLLKLIKFYISSIWK